MDPQDQEAIRAKRDAIRPQIEEQMHAAVVRQQEAKIISWLDTMDDVAAVLEEAVRTGALPAGRASADPRDADME